MAEVDLDVEYYRLRPSKFRDLPNEMQMSILNKDVGIGETIVFKRCSWPDSLFRTVCKISMACNPQISLLDAMFHSEGRTQRYENLASLLIFFRVESWDGLLETRVYNSQFFKHFAFGCFPAESVKDNRNYVIRNYLLGVVTWSVLWLPIENYKTVSDEAHLEIREKAKSLRYNSDDIATAIRISKKSNIKRLQEILGAISQKRFITNSRDADREDRSIHFACFLKYQFERLGEDYQIPRPQWSRQNHSNVTDAKFNKTVMTVLLMTRFRKATFDLHKDLVDAVLEELFKQHLAALEFDCLVTHQVAKYLRSISINSCGPDIVKGKIASKEFSYSGMKELMRLGFSHGICLEDPVTKKIDYEALFDVICLDYGGKISMEKRYAYHEALEHRIMFFEGSGWSPKNASTYSYSQRVIIGTIIVEWCSIRKNQTKIFKLWTGEKKLPDDVIKMCFDQASWR